MIKKSVKANQNHRATEVSPINSFIKLPAMKEMSIAIRVSENFTANFLFYQSPNTSKCRFYVSVVDEKKKAHFFFLDRCNENCWEIQTASELPEWIINLESELNDLISYEVDLEKWETV